MIVPELNLSGLPPAAAHEIAQSGAFFEVEQTQSNGRTLRNLRVVHGPFDLQFLKENEIALLLENNLAGLHVGAPPAQVADPNAPLNRAELAELPPLARMEYVRSGRPLTD